MKRNGYLTRAMKARDPRYARILGKLGYETTREVAADVTPVVPNTPHPLDRDADGQIGGSKPADDRGDDLDALRSSYKEKTGEDADKRWGAARLLREIGA